MPSRAVQCRPRDPGSRAEVRRHASKGRAAPCARTADASRFSMVRDSRVYVKATDDEQQVFRAVAEALGQGENMSAAIRFVMFEKARELGLGKAPANKKARSPK